MDARRKDVCRMPALNAQQKTPTRKVLVLGNDSRSFLAVVRSLGRHALEVHVAWCPPDRVARSSRYIARAHDVPPYSPHDDAWRQALVSLLQQEEFDLVIPCDDPSLIPLQLHRDELEPFGRIYLLDQRSFDVTMDKSLTGELARSLGIRTPKEVVVLSHTTPDELIAAFDFPIVLKPFSSFRSADLATKRYVCKAYTVEELERYLREEAALGQVLAQENFTGTGVGVEVLASRGRILYAFQHQRVHEPLMGGGSSYRKSVPVSPELLEASQKLLAALQYTGVAMLEFKVDLQSGDWVLLEVNGRFWGSLPLALAAGADFPCYLYQMLVGGRQDFPPGYKTNVHCRNWTSDLFWLLENARADRNAPTLAVRPLPAVAAEVVNLLMLRERSDTLVLDDPKPGLAELAGICRKAVSSAARKGRTALLSLPPIRRAYVRKARRAFRHAERVLFACKGNVCRSPFAQLYAGRLFPDAEFASCGYYPQAGRKCPPQAVEAARRMGVDLQGHRSVVMTELLVRAADIVFVFDDENLRRVLADYPFAAAKTHYLSLLGDRAGLAVRDPYGATVADFAEVYQVIARVLDSCAPARK